jgi:hypothetical protein
MVAASKGYKRGNVYNQHKIDGYYGCEDNLTEGLVAVKDALEPEENFCWCNPNFEWDKYQFGQPIFSTYSSKLLYEKWTKQAQLLETRNCDGLVAIVDMDKKLTKSW